MSKQHYGSLAGVVVGYLLCRLLAEPIVRVLGDLGGHDRTADMAIGAVVTAIPFVALAAFTVLRLRAPARLVLRPVKAVFVGAWLVAGVVMGLLPWSRMGTRIDLLSTEAHRAPGLLHGLDVTIVGGLVVTVALLFIALRTRHEPPSAPIHWVEHQFEDER